MHRSKIWQGSERVRWLTELYHITANQWYAKKNAAIGIANYGDSSLLRHVNFAVKGSRKVNVIIKQLMRGNGYMQVAKKGA